MVGLPAEVIEEEVHRNPAKEKYLIDVIFKKRLVVILWPAGLKLLMCSIGKDSSYGECDGNVNLHHVTPLYIRCDMDLYKTFSQFDLFTT